MGADRDADSIIHMTNTLRYVTIDLCAGAAALRRKWCCCGGGRINESFIPDDMPHD